jgi:predicted amidophosphoribosyltransferase
MFDTKRPPVGELLYQLKYGRTQTPAEKLAIADQLAETAVSFLKNSWRIAIDAIVPVPPSNVRAIQPVMVVADALAARLGVPVCIRCLSKGKQTPQLKDITDYDKRKEVLTDAFSVEVELTTGKNLLLFDDLHGSGATVGQIAELLRNPGRAKAVYLLTLTTK